MSTIYIILSEEPEGKFISVYSSLDKAKFLLQNKIEKKGKYTLIKSLVDGIPLKINNDFKLVSLNDI